MGEVNARNQKFRLAILIPCLNEESTIGAVIDGFRQELPEAEIFVFDNASSDTSVQVAYQHGATVHSVARRGKGNVIRRMLANVEADYYLIVDGDLTYPPESAQTLLEPLLQGKADMTVGARLESYSQGSFPTFHRFGNQLITSTVNRVFGTLVTDVLSGYRALTRHCAKTVPLASKGFEIETELTINALDRSMEIVEVPVHYSERPDGSVSKLSTFRDGFLIMYTIFNILKDFRPLLFFSTMALTMLLSGFGLGLPIIVEYIHTGLVPRFPTAILAASMVLLAFQLVGVGLMLDTVGNTRRLQFDLIDKL